VSYFGYSQLALYKACPKRYWFERISQRPDSTFDCRNAFLGSLLGGLLARFYTERWWALGARAKPRMTVATHEISADLHTKIDYPWTRGEWQEHMATAQAAIPTILDVVVREQLIAPRMEIELPVEVVLDTGDILTGTPDLVLDKPGSLVLLDAKGGGRIGKYVAADQLRLYQLGLASHPRYQRLPDKVGFWWLRHGKIVWKRTPKTALPKWVEGVKRTITRLKDGDFAANPGPLCRYCAFRAECPEGMATLREVKTVLASDEATGIISL
jgi:hypothetical protein